jgi:hypothetical protein
MERNVLSCIFAYISAICVNQPVNYERQNNVDNILQHPLQIETHF